MTPVTFAMNLLHHHIKQIFEGKNGNDNMLNFQHFHFSIFVITLFIIYNYMTHFVRLDSL